MLRKVQPNLQQRLISFILLIVLSAFIMVLDRVGVLSPVEQVTSVVTGPVEFAAFQLGHNLSDLTLFFDTLDKLKAENRQLSEKLQVIQQEQAKSADIASQLFELEKELAFKRNPDNQRYQIAGADVINHDSTGLFQSIRINKGSNDKITVGMPVLDASGFLVGRISKVESKSALALLLTDSNMAVNVMNKRFGADGKLIGIQKGADGTAVGQWQVGGSITIFRITKDADIKAGDYIFTNGKGGTFPSNILVGQVAKIIDLEVEPNKQAIVNPASDFNRITRVQVILSVNEP